MKIKVCVGSNCTMMGADGIIDSLENIKETTLTKPGVNPAFTLDIEMVRCIGECKKMKNISPVVVVDDVIYHNASREEIMSLVLDAAFDHVMTKSDAGM